jgi:5-methylthioribose kinase
MVEDQAAGVVLDGGVASDVRALETADGPIVIKKALPRLKVAAEWLSDPARSLVEVMGISAFADLVGPEFVPEILWARPADHCFAMRLVDPRLRNWKSDLLAGRVDLATAERVGSLLGRFHTRSAGSEALREQFDDLRYFCELRLEPFFDYVALQRPDLAERITSVADGMAGRRSALVHGDYSPKNILADGADIVILDFEVAHWGDPRFDVAFCLAHLMLKSTMPSMASKQLSAAIRVFLAAYRLAGPPVIDAALANLTGCLLLARLFGKSPADYLGQIDTRAVERRAIELLHMTDTPALPDFLLFTEQYA